MECILSGVYIWSLLGLLNLKSSVRQRRVMCDLIYVNLIIVSLDIVVVILTYLNQTGISHPIQTFNYTLKLKLEFVVLNQLMAVAVRGSRRPRFEEMRYRHPSARDEFSAECHQWDAKSPSKKHQRSQPDALEKYSSARSVQLTVPSPALSRLHQSPAGSTNEDGIAVSRPQRHVAPPSAANVTLYDPGKVDGSVYGAEQECPSDNFLDDASVDANNHETTESLRPLDSAPRGAKPHQYHQRFRDAKDQALRAMGRPPKNESRKRIHSSQPDADHRRERPMKGRMTRRIPTNGKDLDEEGCEEEEIGVHMWENRKGSLIMEVPWFKSRIEAEP